MTSGIHHVTGITARVQANVDFYAGFLGLRLIKRTGGFEDSAQLHLFYGDAAGSPGSILSFLVWEGGARGRTGHGQLAEVALAVPRDSLGTWMTRAMAAQVPHDGPGHEFGAAVLRLRDPDGLTVKLVGTDTPAVAPLSDPAAPRRLAGVTLLSERPEETAAFVGRFGYRAGGVSGAVRRMMSETDIVDIRDATGFVPGAPGAGVLDHVAFRASDAGAVRSMRRGLAMIDSVTRVHDRKYFLSLYAREPGGALIEYATDGPGFTVDEMPEHLGQTLFVPPHDAARAEDLKLILPQFALPGEERFPMRDLPFVHRFHRPDDPDGSVLVLLHGTGGDETDLMPFAHRLNPRATLLGVRGRSTEEGHNRWFRRFTAVTFDQADILAEAAAFAAFVGEAIRAYGLDAGRMTFVGYSNGANLLGAVMQAHPGAVRRAILLRSIQVLEAAPETGGPVADVLMLDGARDPIARGGPDLGAALRIRGATVEGQYIDAGHELVPADVEAARVWLKAQVD